MNWKFVISVIVDVSFLNEQFDEDDDEIKTQTTTIIYDFDEDDDKVER